METQTLKQRYDGLVNVKRAKKVRTEARKKKFMGSGGGTKTEIVVDHWGRKGERVVKNRLSAGTIRRLEHERLVKRDPSIEWSLKMRLERGLICRDCGREIMAGTARCWKCGLR